MLAGARSTLFRAVALVVLSVGLVVLAGLTDVGRTLEGVVLGPTCDGGATAPYSEARLVTVLHESGFRRIVHHARHGLCDGDVADVLSSDGGEGGSHLSCAVRRRTPADYEPAGVVELAGPSGVVHIVNANVDCQLNVGRNADVTSERQRLLGALQQL